MIRLTEIEVFNATRAYLAAGRFTVLQLVPPGGQAPISLTFHDGIRKRTCFPDLIAWKTDTLWIGELKSGFSAADHDKIRALLLYAEPQLRECMEARLMGVASDQSSIKGVLCHSDTGTPRKVDVHQLIFAEPTAHNCLKPARTGLS